MEDELDEISRMRGGSIRSIQEEGKEEDEPPEFEPHQVDLGEDIT